MLIGIQKVSIENISGKFIIEFGAVIANSAGARFVESPGNDLCEVSFAQTLLRYLGGNPCD